MIRKGAPKATVTEVTSSLPDFSGFCTQDGRVDRIEALHTSSSITLRLPRRLSRSSDIQSRTNSDRFHQSTKRPLTPSSSFRTKPLCEVPERGSTLGTTHAIPSVSTTPSTTETPTRTQGTRRIASAYRRSPGSPSLNCFKSCARLAGITSVALPVCTTIRSSHPKSATVCVGSSLYTADRSPS